jgi:IS30 family transposase
MLQGRLQQGKPTMAKAKYKHLSDEDRLQIEHGLRQNMSFRKIAKLIAKDKKNVQREVKKHRVESLKGAQGRITNRCVNRNKCHKTQLCMDMPDCVKRCSACKGCNFKCEDFQEEVCGLLSKPPYVCNGCEKEHVCVLKKRFYVHTPAHKNDREILSSARGGANITEQELLNLDTLVSPLVAKGQSIHHILVNNPNRFDIHEKTLYRYIAGGLLRAKNGDMPRVCGLKPRKTKPVEHKIDTKCRVGRAYEDYKAFMAENPDTPVVEMDTVKGGLSGKCLLTLQFVKTGFMLAFLRERNDAQSVIDAFTTLWEIAEAVQPGLFQRLFPVLLTDNGSAFSNPLALAFAPDGTRRTHVFYCDPCASWQKPHVENNPAFIRLVCPKGTRLDGLVQADINVALSNINSYSRPVLNDKAPMDVFALLYGEVLLAKLDMRRIPSNNIVLKPYVID